MKTFPCCSATFAALVLGFQPCSAQTPRAEIVGSPPTPATQQALENPGLQTRVFRVPPDFLNKGGPPGTGPSAPNPSAVKVLESLGISFSAPGSTATHSPATSKLVVRNTLEQLDLVESVVEHLLGENATMPQGHVHLEIFSMPPLTARKALIAHPREADLHAWLNAELGKRDGLMKLEHHSITIVRGGQRSKTEAIGELGFPTQFDPPKIPQNISLPVAATSTTTPAGDAIFAPWPRTGITPQSIEYRNVGHTFEVEMTFGEGGRTVDLNLATQFFRRIGIVKWGLMEEIYQPDFETRTIDAQASSLVGQPILVGTFSPPINTGVPGGNQVDRTWLLFVTVKKPE